MAGEHLIERLTFEERHRITKEELRLRISDAKQAQLLAEEEAFRAKLKWTRRKAIALFQDFADFHGRNPTAADLRKHHGLPSYRTTVNLFGSLKNGLIEAGLLK